MRVLVVQNCEPEGAGLYERFLRDRAVVHEVFHAYRETTFPSPDDYDACVIGGTPVAAYDVHRHAFLRAEWLFVEALLGAGKPCLGICFGGQLLARLLRARVYPHSAKEIGGGEVRLTPPGREDPVFAGFPEEFPVFQWHADTFDVPEGAALVAEGAACGNQAFRRGGAVALQFHLEVTAADVARWADAYRDELQQVGKTKDEVVAECEAREERMRPLAERLMANFLALAGRNR
ncbi:MAG: type 1 glutamine amidotransferase [Planctomycetota bacterium]|jgi:GMP synthase-like glutamine amidotransferase